jgi:hypothetical protein
MNDLASLGFNWEQRPEWSPSVMTNGSPEQSWEGQKSMVDAEAVTARATRVRRLLMETILNELDKWIGLGFGCYWF